MGILWSCGPSPQSEEKAKEKAQPSKRSYSLVFTEDLRFGAEQQDPNYIWSLNTTTVSADKAGNIYVADPHENRVLMFDAQGAFVKKVAGKGEGPGEFSGLVNFMARADGRGIGLDMSGAQSSLSTFGPGQSFQQMSRNGGKPALIQSAIFDPSMDRFASFYVQPDKAAGLFFYKTAVFDAGFKVLVELSSDSGPLPNHERFGEANYWSERIAENLTRFFKGYPVCNFDAEGRLYSANPNKYTISRWSKDLSKSEVVIDHSGWKPILRDEANHAAIVELFTAQVASDPELAQLVTPAVIKRAVETAEIPPNKNPVFAILPMEDGKVLVVHDINFSTGVSTADLFSEKGEYLTEVTMGHFAFATLTASGYLPRMVFRNGFAYTIESNEADEQSVVRYRYQLRAN